MPRKGRNSRMSLEVSMNLWKYFLDSISLERGRNSGSPFKTDLLMVTEEELKRRSTNLNLDNEINPTPTAESVKTILGLLLNKSSTDTHSIEEYLIRYFDDKKEIKTKFEDYSNGNSNFQNITILANNMVEVIDEIIEKKEEADNLLYAYKKYIKLYQETTKISSNLEIGEINKENANKLTKNCLQSVSSLIVAMNSFYEEIQEDEEIKIASAALIGNSRKLKDSFMDNMKELENKNIQIFNTEAIMPITVESVTTINNQQKNIIETIRNTRLFNDPEHEKNILLDTETRIFKNQMTELLEDFRTMENKRIDTAHLQVMKSMLEKTESQLDNVMKLNPDFTKDNISISYQIDDEVKTEDLDVKNILKTIKYEYFKIVKNMEDEEKENQNKQKSSRESTEKSLPKEELPFLNNSRFALVWYHEVTRMASKFKDNEEYESRFSQLLRKSIKIEEDRNQTSTFIKPHEIVDYIKSKYIDSGQAIKSCLQDIINRSSPRNLIESITALEMTNNQLQLFKSLKYEYLLTHSLMDTLTLKCL